MGALVLKNHFTMTADRAVLAERLTGLPCFGGVVLNLAVGGLNTEAITRCIVRSIAGHTAATWTANPAAIVRLSQFGMVILLKSLTAAITSGMNSITAAID